MVVDAAYRRAPCPELPPDEEAFGVGWRVESGEERGEGEIYPRSPAGISLLLLRHYTPRARQKAEHSGS